MPHRTEEEFTYVYAEWIEGSDADWQKKAENLIDAIRLFSVNRAGLGLMINRCNGLGTNDLYPFMSAGCLLQNNVPAFRIKKDEKQHLADLYDRIAELKDDPSDKSDLICNLLRLFRLSYAAPDYKTAFLLQIVMWETFSREFPDYEIVVYDGYFQSRLSEKTRSIIAKVIQNKKGEYWGIHDAVKYLYDQRSRFVHGDEGLRPKTFVYAFDISRRLLCKLIMSSKSKEEIIQMVHSSLDKKMKKQQNSDVLFTDYVSTLSFDDDTMKLIQDYIDECKKKNNQGGYNHSSIHQ